MTFAQTGIAPITAPNLNAPHLFTTRSGGVSEGAFASLNLGLSSGDRPSAVEANRDRLLAAIGLDRDRVCAVDQVHGTRVLEARAGWFEEEADALVGVDPEVLLVVSVADCYPVLVHDPVRGAVAAAHCGWRGTLAGLAGAVVGELQRRFGSDPARLQVAIGPGICGGCYQVGGEVRDAFVAAGFSEAVARPDDEGRWRLDLVAANLELLIAAGVDPERVWSAGTCTFENPDRFFSYRRDAGRTGRHWAAIRPAGG